MKPPEFGLQLRRVELHFGDLIKALPCAVVVVRFEDRCRVNVSDGFAAKGSFRQLVWPSSDKSYPCRHLHETIL